MKNTIKNKLLVYFSFSFIIVLIFYSLMIYLFIRKDLDKEMETRLISVGKIIKNTLNMDEFQYLIYKGKIYKNWQEALKKLKNITEINNIFIIDKNKKVIFSLTEGEEFFIDIDNYEIKQALKGKIISSPLYKGIKGKFYKTGYIPLIKDNKVLGVMGIEASAKYLMYIKKYKFMFLITGIIIFLIFLLVSLLISKSITSNLTLLNKKAEEIAKRNFNEKIVLKNAEKELQNLFNTIENMKNELLTYIKEKEKLASVGEFSAGVAHEIRNSLGVLRGYAELIKENTDNDKIKNYAKKIIINVSKMNEFLNNFLIYTKDITPEFQKINVKQFVEEFCAEIDERLKEVIALNITDDNIVIKTDIFLLKKVLYNIIKNAYEAIENEDKRIDIKIEKKDNIVIISIKDNGIGLDDKEKEKIFHPFFSKKKEGVGLGLAISYKIIKEVLKGDIKVISEKNKGSEFLIYLKGDFNE